MNLLALAEEAELAGDFSNELISPKMRRLAIGGSDFTRTEKNSTRVS